MKSVRELSHACSHIVLKCLYLARIGRREILWSVNKFERSISKRTKACDRHLARLISYIAAKNADWDCFKILTLREILRTQNLLLMEHYAFVEVMHLFQHVGCVRNKHQFHSINVGRYHRNCFMGFRSLQFLKTRIRTV